MAGTTTPRSVAVLGLGPMGGPIAHNLIAAGCDVTVWNRSAPPLSALRDAGARVVNRVEEIDSDVILSVLPDVDQLRTQLNDEVLDAWTSHATAPQVVVVMSTTSPQKIEALARDLEARGIGVADAAMSGGDAGARSGALSIMVGARDHDWQTILPLLQLVGSTVVRFGQPGAGSIAKLCNQVVVAGTLAALSEALAIAERAKLDLGQLTDVFAGGLAASALLTQKKDKLLNRDYSLGGSLRNQVKDLRYATEVARGHGLPTPLAELLMTLFTTAEDRGFGDLDHSALREIYRMPDAP